jgi:hypothetical protein
MKYQPVKHSMKVAPPGCHPDAKTRYTFKEGQTVYFCAKCQREIVRMTIEGIEIVIEASRRSPEEEWSIVEKEEVESSEQELELLGLFRDYLRKSDDALSVYDRLDRENFVKKLMMRKARKI